MGTEEVVSVDGLLTEETPDVEPTESEVCVEVPLDVGLKVVTLLNVELLEMEPSDSELVTVDVSSVELVGEEDEKEVVTDMSGDVAGDVDNSVWRSVD